MSTLRERVASKMAHVSDDYWQGLVSHADEEWPTILIRYRTEADSIFALLRAEVKRIVNPHRKGDCATDASRNVGFEQCRQAVLKVLE